MVIVTAGWSYVLLGRDSSWLPWLQVAVLILGAAVAVLMSVVNRLPDPVGRIVAVAAVLASLAGPAAYAVATVATPHAGAVPSAGPRGHQWHPGAPRKPHGPPGPGGPPGPAGLLTTAKPGPALTSTLRTDAGRYTWAAATIGSNNAAGYQLAARAPVMAVGGYNGTDPSPTLPQFQSYVKENRIHFFVGGSMMGPRHGTPSGSDDANRIAQWVAAHCPVRTIDGVTVYDLSQPLTADA